LILEAPEDQAEKAGEVLGKAMETAMELSVPLVAEVAAGRRWSDLK
jgi:DNA polymerase I-like protein with 3'-5' exonuclease and polymerase domains